ncbi:MAG: ATP-binding cassette domain-containing protein [Azospirillum sp.]|nr:ATP-binding cassette domain-containing protein [Azospirillum sp.]
MSDAPRQEPVQISVKNLSVDLPAFNIHNLSLKKNLLRIGSNDRIHAQSKTVIIHALRNFSFEVHDGDRIGLIGLNGSGKTTLLRTLAGVYRPTAGTISVQGRVVPMLTSGIGMYEDASGFNNIRNCGVQLGMTLQEIEAKMPEIAAFTGLGDYLSLPIYTYSSGMRVRLTFAISTAVDADILLLDEVMSAGDASFAHKAAERFQSLLNRIRILVVASHNEDWMREWCNKAILISDGHLLECGPTDAVLKTYKALVQHQD